MYGGGDRRHGIAIFDDLHRYLPALLYDPGRFTTVQSVLAYVRHQARYHLDTFSRADREFRQRLRQGPRAPSPAPAEQESQTVFMDALLRGLFPAGTGATPILTTTMEFVNPVGAGAGIFDFMNPVPVRPTQQQLDAGSELVDGGAADAEAICAICQEALRIPEGTTNRRLRHCRHTFHRACIDTWFTSHVQCPECRHDIREP